MIFRILYLRYAVSVHKHALELVIDADVIQNRNDYMTIVLSTLQENKTNNNNKDIKKTPNLKP